jgi:DNA primase
MSDTVQQIKDRLNIVDVVGPYVKLTKAGKYHKGLCPFHKEKSPSFMVTPDRGFFHCFGCGKGGDLFTFVEEMERVDFKGALKILAEKAGVPIVYGQGEDKSARDRLYAVLEAARDFFVAHLDSAARGYLVDRGILGPLVTQWSLGYAPAEWRALVDHLRTKGFPDADMLSAGLGKKKEGTPHLYDTFRGRIIFPIRDSSGRVIAFTGRIFPNEEGQAKYLNSPETALFEKSKVLYGIDIAKGGIRSLNSAILVEGQVDLLMAHQAGYTNTLALSGTAFTDEHAALIKRHTENLVIAFDGDRAGIAAAGRAASIALSAGLNVKVAAMPPGEDPADLIRRDSALWKQAIRDAVHVIDFYLAHLMKAGYDARQLKLEASRVVLPYVVQIQNAIDQAHFIQRVAEAIGVPEDAVRVELRKLEAGSVKQESGASNSNLQPSTSFSLERLLSALKEETEDRALVIEADLFLEQYPGSRADAVRELEAELAKREMRGHYRAVVARLKDAEQRGGDVDALMVELARLAKSL